jgi:hypothetical protein
MGVRTRGLEGVEEFSLSIASEYCVLRTLK